MFDTICTLPLTSDLFAQAIHPKSSIVAVGLASGHVQTYILPNLGSSPDTAPKNGCGTIDTAWRTKRHKGSCRSLTFSSDGEILYSAGTDGIVKAARTETGVVEAKIAVPLHNSLPDPPSLIYALTPQSLLLATDSSALHLYDLRNPLSKLSSTPQATHHPHADYISSLTPLPPTAASTSGFPKQFVTTGGSTLAVTDLRRGVLVKSEDQEEELLSSVFVSGVGKDGKGERVLVGTGSGVLTVWEKGVWEDQQGRVIVDGVGKESLDALTLVPGEQGTVGVGMGDGKVKFVKMGSNQVVGECRHDELEGVVGLGFDVGGRVISGGGGVVKVWQESVEEEYEGEEADRVDGVDGVGRKRGLDDSDDDNEDEGDSESSEEEEKVRKKGRKRKRGNEKAKNGGKAVMGFTGID